MTPLCALTGDGGGLGASGGITVFPDPSASTETPPARPTRLRHIRGFAEDKALCGATVPSSGGAVVAVRRGNSCIVCWDIWDNMDQRRRRALSVYWGLL